MIYSVFARLSLKVERRSLPILKANTKVAFNVFCIVRENQGNKRNLTLQVEAVSKRGYHQQGRILLLLMVWRGE